MSALPVQCVRRLLGAIRWIWALTAMIALVVVTSAAFPATARTAPDEGISVYNVVSIPSVITSGVSPRSRNRAPSREVDVSSQHDLSGRRLGVFAAKFGLGSGPWAEGVGARAGGAIGQSTEESCVSACGAMLSGRSEADLLANLGEWSNPKALARELGDG